MHDKKRFNYLFTILMLLFFMQQLPAQQPSLKVTVDKNEILLGEQVNFTITASWPSADFKVHGFGFPDTVAHFDILQRSKIDTVSENNLTRLQQVITLTSFDSGQWKMPAFPVNFDPVKDDTTLNIFTDSIPVKVLYVTDTTKDLRDIKPIRTIEVNRNLFYYFAGAIFGISDLFIIIFSIIGLIKGRHKQPAGDPRNKVSSKNAYEEAMNELKLLETYDLSDPVVVKKYHILVSEIFRQYLGNKINISLLNKTTGEILVEIPGRLLSHEQVSRIAASLRCGDAVKFAKYIPPLIESRDSLERVKETISLMEHSELNK